MYIFDLEQEYWRGKQDEKKSQQKEEAAENRVIFEKRISEDKCKTANIGLRIQFK